MRIAAVTRYATKLFFRPKPSLMYPKDTYPRNVPVCIVTTIKVVHDVLNPKPPRVGGNDKYAGIHRLKPQYAKIVDRLSNVSSIVLRAKEPLKIVPMEYRAPCFCECVQISDSRTVRLIQSVSNAGNTPTKKAARQPNL